MGCGMRGWGGWGVSVCSLVEGAHLLNLFPPPPPLSVCTEGVQCEHTREGIPALPSMQEEGRQ